MQNHPVVGDPLFAKEMLHAIDEGFGFSTGPPSPRDSLLTKMRRAIAAALRRVAERVEVRTPCNQALIDCNG